jgi:hypothetical protein
MNKDLQINAQSQIEYQNLILTNAFKISIAFICLKHYKKNNMSIGLGLAGVGLATSLYGGWKAGKEQKKMDRQIRGWEADNKAFYNSRALGDYTQRADAQNALRQMREQLDRQSKRATNTQAITGGTIEQTAVSKDSANKALADATSNIAAVGQQFKDRVTDQYMGRKQQLQGMQYQNTAGKANSYENLMQSGLNTAAGALSSLVQKPNS